MLHRPRLLSCSLLLLLLAGRLGAQATLSPATAELDRRVAASEVFAAGHTGFCLNDLTTGQELYAYNADRYFVPASNVKLLTFYLAQRELDHAAPALFFRTYPNRTELWGSGYPLLLHPAFREFDELSPWLIAQQQPLVFNFPAAEELPRYGAGWSWDDYNYGYSFERSPFPVYGDRLHLDFERAGEGGEEVLQGTPPEVVSSLALDLTQEYTIRRREGSNAYSVGPGFTDPDNFPLERPLTVSPEFTVRQLEEAFPNAAIRLGTAPRPPASQLGFLTVSLPDTVYRKFLQDSDNYLAEQLVLQAAAARYGTLDEEMILDYATDTLFAGLGLSELRYADGSGLSRYNLVKPRQFVRLLLALDREVGHDRLLSLLPAGGQSGTLKQRFANRPATYVWAKTGTLSGVTCLSGLIRSKAGHWMAFSFLHNNVVGRTTPYYREMDDILGWIYDTL